MDTNIKERILLHLDNYAHKNLKRKTSYYVSQKGISESVSGSRSRVSRILRDMKKDNLVKIKKKYINNNENRKQNAYYLTNKGKKKVSNLKNKLKKKKVKVQIDNEIKKLKIEQLMDKISSENPLLDISVKLKNKDILNIKNKNNMNKIDFVNRTKEFNRLKTKLEEVKDGNTRALFISGEAGCGKTTLVMKFKDYIKEQNISFLNGRAYTESSDFYLPLKNAFRDYENKDEYSLNSILELNMEKKEMKKIDDSKVAQASKRSVFFDFKEEIKKITKDEPIVLFIDDLQWADNATIDLINYLIHNLDDAPILFICAYRSEVIEKKHKTKDVINRLSRYDKFETMTVEPFNWKNTKKMIDALINTNKSPQNFIDLIYDRSEGNPLFIKEFIELLEDENLLPVHTSEYPTKKRELEIPQLIEGVLKRRAEIHLSDKALNVAQVGSVIGEEIPFELLYQSLNINEVELLDTIDELLELKIWDENENRYIFSHDLISEVIYDDLPSIKKQRLHKIIAENIITLYEDKISNYYSEIAFHFERANENDKAVKNYLKAGEEALNLYAFEDAIEIYEKALDLCKECDNIEILRKLAEANKIIGNYEDAIDHFYHILENADDDSIRLNSRIKLGSIFINQGKFEKALEMAEDGLNEHDLKDNFYCKLKSIKGQVYTRRGIYDKAKEMYSEEKKIAENIKDDEELAQSLHHLGAVDIHKGNLESAKRYLKKSAEIREKIEDKIALAESFNNLGIAYEKEGNYDKAFEYFKRTLKIEKKIGNEPNIMKTLNNMGIYSKIKGNIEEALEYYNESLSIAKKINDKPGMAKLNVNIGIIQGSIGNQKKALEHLKKALDIQEKIEDRPGMAGTLDNIGTIYQHKGNFEKALDFHERSLQVGKEIGDKNSIGSSLYNIGSVSDKKGNFKKALNHYEESLNIINKTGNRRLKTYIFTGFSETYIHLQKYDKAEENAKKALQISKSIGLNNGLAATKRYIGKINIQTNSLEKAENELKEALELLEDSIEKSEKFKIYYEMSKIHKNRNEKQKAKEYLQEAINNFKNYDMKWWLNQCKNELEDLEK